MLSGLFSGLVQEETHSSKKREKFPGFFLGLALQYPARASQGLQPAGMHLTTNWKMCCVGLGPSAIHITAEEDEKRLQQERVKDRINND